MLKSVASAGERQSVSVHLTSLSEHKLIPRVLETFDWPTAIGFRFLQRFVSPGECWTSCCVYTGRATTCRIAAVLEGSRARPISRRLGSSLSSCRYGKALPRPSDTCASISLHLSSTSPTLSYGRRLRRVRDVCLGPSIACILYTLHFTFIRRRSGYRAVFPGLPGKLTPYRQRVVHF
ncbi:hypothetical protein KC349_g286 [Hortaea werneckii]|nr:hypothetical protein KC349_g286 [Hortaea werneckii]